MHIRFFCPRWGSEDVAYEAFFEKVKKAGYDGVEMSLPLDKRERDRIVKLLKEYELLLIGQHWECTLSDSGNYEKDFENYLMNLAEVKPLLINSQTGKDYFSFERNVALIRKADTIAEQTGVKIVHETHRGKFSFSVNVIAPYLGQLPDMRLCGDFSHWCNVAESLLQEPEQQAVLQKVIRRVDHIHARVGFSQSAQISDPRAPEYQEAVDCHLHWWDLIVEQRSSEGTEILTVTPEFGPAPYMPLLPYTRQPLTSQWEVNRHMKEILKQRYRK